MCTNELGDFYKLQFCKELDLGIRSLMPCVKLLSMSLDFWDFQVHYIANFIHLSLYEENLTPNLWNEVLRYE